MSEKSASRGDGGNSYSIIKVPENDDTYLETTSGKESIRTDIQETTCGICGFSARTKEELQDHTSHAHNKEEASVRQLD